MDNVLGTQGVPLTVFGGAVTEMAPEDLPEGASPFNQDCDYSPGSVFTRGGRSNQIAYAGLYVTALPGFAASVPGPNDPNELPWANPLNITLDLPVTYAVASVNNTGSGGGGSVSAYEDFSVTNFSGSNGFNIQARPSTTDLGIYIFATNSLHRITVSPDTPAPLTNSLTGVDSGFSPSSWGTLQAGTLYSQNPSFTSDFPSNGQCCGLFLGFPTTGTPTVNLLGSTSGAFNTTVQIGVGNLTVPPNTPALLMVVVAGAIVNNPSSIASVTDTYGNVWQRVGLTGSFPVEIEAWMCVSPTAAVNYSFFVGLTPGSFYAGAQIGIYYMTAIKPAFSPPYTQILQGSNFNLNIPTNKSIVGMQVLIDGHQTSNVPGTGVLVNVDGYATQILAQLPLADGTTPVGSPNSNWSVPLTPALVNSPTFKIDVYGNAPPGVSCSFFITGVKIRVWLSNAPPANVNYLKTYEQTNAQVDTLVLDSNGVLWDEQVNYGAGAGILNGIFLNIQPGSFAQSETFSDIEYIAFSNLLNGTDIPRQWNGSNLDRVSMCGPGAPPQAVAQSANQSIVSITQAPSTQIRRIAWGASANAINDSTPGNVLVIFGEGRTGSNTYQSLPNAVVGGTIVLSGLPTAFPKKGGGTIPYNINGTYTILQVTTAVVGGNEICPVFTVQAPAIAYGYSNDFGSGGPPPTSGWFYQATLATMTTAAQVPNLSVGNQFNVTGTGGAPPAGYDGPWTVLGTPNAAQMVITSTQLNGGIATYSYNLVSGVAPVTGQYVTVTGTLNGSGIFNVQNVTITAASAGSFSVNISSPNIGPAAENGSGIIFGTIFTFEPGQLVGNKTGGALASQGTIATGIRKVCYSFLTRTGFITQPSPIATFNVLAGSNSIVVSGLLPGPPNVVARIIHLTGANGGNFFNIPQPVTVISSGSPVVSSSTWVNDNTSTSVTLSFADGVLLAATGVDIPGNNLFADMELGSSRGFITYAQRMIAWSEQNKIMNLRNLSFDGGLAGANQGGGVTTTYPAGWTVDPTNGGGESLITSPIFGFAVQIQNTSGITQAIYGMLTQPAYLDEFLVPIVQSAAAYSVRVTASCPSGAAGGNLVVDLFSPSFNQAFGAFSVPLASMSSTMQIFTGTLLVTPFAQVPKDLVIRIYATAIANNVTVLIDRCEPFPTLQPVFTTQMRASYANNQEAFDLVTGAFGPAQNQQPINGAARMWDLLYALKEASWFSTSDNGVTEPNQWNWKTVSDKVGTIGIHSYDYGEGWMLTANRRGVYFFEGGEPIKISQEIQPLWDLINWSAGATIWLRNDPEQRRITIGVPIPTPNPYMPEFPVNANPTTPNVILMCNYRELNSGAALAQGGPIHATYTGRIISPEPARKWSFWNISSPASDYIDRGNNTWPQWFGTGYSDSKIFALDYATLSDDGNAINSFYVTYGFVKPEMSEAKGLGLFRMQFDYMTLLAVGAGTLNPYVYPESPANTPYVLDQAPLPAVSAGDLEVGVNIKGQRFFIRVGTNAVGANWRLSKLVVALSPDPWSPIRGLTSASA